MLKIKDYIFNENNIYSLNEEEGNGITIYDINDKEDYIDNATFEDIEWNYDKKSDSGRVRQLEATLERRRKESLNKTNKIKELEEENKKLNELVQFNVETTTILTKRINKAIEYIENMPYVEVPDEDYENNHKMVEWDNSDLLKILKGEENEL